MILQAKKKWTESLQNSSIGLHFPLESEDTKETPKEMKFFKLIQFYHAEYEIPDYPTQVESLN
jgi:hypothetical protein